MHILMIHKDVKSIHDSWIIRILEIQTNKELYKKGQGAHAMI